MTHRWIGNLAAMAAGLTLLAAALSCHAAPAVEGTLPSDAKFFARLNLDHPGLEKTRNAVRGKDYASARHELAAYYRARTGRHFTLPPQEPGKGTGNRAVLMEAVRPLLERTGHFDASLWKGDTFDWNGRRYKFRERMYCFGAFGKAYAMTGDETIAREWVKLVRSFVAGCPLNKKDTMWYSMDVGIRMRTGWPEAFHCFIKSPSFSDDDVVLFLKSVCQQTDFIRHNHDETSNWLTFAMVGLYTSGAMYPEFADAAAWREYACRKALADMDIGWLPDGMTIELSPGYGQFFSNYFAIHDLAREIGRLDEFGISALPAKTGKLYDCFLRIMAPDGFTPATNDNGPQDVAWIMKAALKRHPQREDFRWAATGGKAGRAPDYTSVLLPYAGFAAMRSGWERDANMLYFDIGPVGYRHAHQDKLQVVLWAYGRQILFDPGRTDYSDTRHSNYCLDTFSHNTVLVDSRPQRRIWYKNPAPKNAPYKKLKDIEWTSNDTFDHAAGVYAEAYGLPGESNAYPYAKDSNFADGWGNPATHHRRVLFLKPDVFVVADTLTPRDRHEHTYDVRWHLDSTHTLTAADGVAVRTADAGLPNLEIVPLLAEGLTTSCVTAQDEPEILGWKVTAVSTPATTLRHLKRARGVTRFVTLLLPMRSGQEPLFRQAAATAPGTVRVSLSDGRELLITVPHDTAEPITACTVSGSTQGISTASPGSGCLVLTPVVSPSVYPCALLLTVFHRART